MSRILSYVKQLTRINLQFKTIILYDVKFKPLPNNSFSWEKSEICRLGKGWANICEYMLWQKVA